MSKKTTTIALLAVIAIGGIRAAKADYYGNQIRRQQDIATYNGYHANAEAKMYKQRAKAYRKAQKRFKRYGIAHSKAMIADAALVGTEARMYKAGYKPARSYVSDWAAMETAAVMIRREGY